jgi:hypothetical protein
MQEDDLNQPGPDWHSIISYLIAAAILVPIGWWAKDNIAPHVAEWIRGLV